MTYAILPIGPNPRTVANTVSWDGESEWSPGAGYEAVEAEGVAIGDVYDGETFTRPAAPEPARRLIAKSTVQERVNAIGKLDEVMAVLNSQSIFFARWFAPDWPNVYFDDEGLLGILAAVGCTAAEIETITAP